MWNRLDFIQITSLILNLIIVILSLFLISFFTLKSKRNGIFYSFISIQISILIWGSGLVMEILLKANSYLSWVVLYYYYLGICSICVNWLIFSIYYTESPLIKKRSKLLLLYVPEIIFYIFLITNHYHNLFYKVNGTERDYGIIFIFHTVYSYVSIIIAMFILIRYAFQNKSLEIKQVYVVIISALVPFFTNAVFLILDLKVKVTSFSFIMSSILFTFATYKLRFMNIVPVSLLRYVDYMNEAVIVVNAKGEIETCNISFKKVFKDFPDINVSINSFSSFLKSRLMNKETFINIIDAIESGCSERTIGEICICCPEITYFLVTIQPVISKRGQILGRVVSFSNVNEYKQLMVSLNEKNAELSVMNDQLIEYASQVEELAILKERNRISKDMHDSVGHIMTVLISLIGVCKMQIKSNTEDAETKLDDALIIAKEGLADIRKSIKGFAMKDMESANIIASIENLVDSYKSTGIEIDFSVDGKPQKLGLEIRYVLFRVCQEAFTNSIRHGKATHISVILILNSQQIKLYIIDNGRGCKAIEPGMGLRGMAERVKALNGTIAYGSNDDMGFNIHIEIPLVDRRVVNYD